MGIFSSILGVFGPAISLVDSLIMTKEEKAEIKAKFMEVQYDVMGTILDYEKQLMQAKAKIVHAEATSSGWLTRSWRPITMLVFLGLIVLDSFGLLKAPLPEQAWYLLQLGIGGYILGRSAEKILPKIMETMKEVKKGNP